jgi:carbamoyl-phosphate synthase large subunit
LPPKAGAAPSTSSASAPEGDYAIYEYNGRYTGATGARQLLGYDEVGMGLEHFGGIRLPESPAPHAWPDAVQRLPVSRAVEAGWVETLERTGHWKGRRR